jgi:hypothetical protein
MRNFGIKGFVGSSLTPALPPASAQVLAPAAPGAHAQASATSLHRTLNLSANKYYYYYCRRRRRLVGCSCCSGFVEQSLCCYMRARSLGASSSCLMHGGNTTQQTHTCGQRDLRGKGTSDVRAKGPPGPQGRAPVRRISIAAVASASCSH